MRLKRFRASIAARTNSEKRQSPSSLAALVRRVDLPAMEERVVRDEVDRNGRPGQEVPEEPDAVGQAEDRNVEGRQGLLGPRVALAIPLGRLEVEREKDVDVVPSGREGLRESPDHVAESAGLRERNALGGEMRDSQRNLS